MTTAEKHCPDPDCFCCNPEFSTTKQETVPVRVRKVSRTLQKQLNDDSFELMRHIRDPALRAALKLSGWRNGMTFLMAERGEPVLDVLVRHRNSLDDRGHHVCMVTRTEEKPVGFSFHVIPLLIM